ncbi:hypothetical protein ABZP36_022893 [Zizania latifolia]
MNNHYFTREHTGHTKQNPDEATQSQRRGVETEREIQIYGTRGCKLQPTSKLQTEVREEREREGELTSDLDRGRGDLARSKNGRARAEARTSSSSLEIEKRQTLRRPDLYTRLASHAHAAPSLPLYSAALNLFL